jgi:hypothetical protein
MMMVVADTFTNHHHARNDKSIGSKRVHKEKEKVHDGAKEVHWKCLQENKMGQQQVQGLVQGRKGVYGENDKAIKDDVESGAHGKWEKLYKKICDAINKSNQIDQGSSSSDDEMDYSVLYAEV